MSLEKARKQLSVEDWARAALVAIGEGGITAVAVEPLAVRLGTTKGSFYWHFPNRDALIEAALALWEREHTEAIIAGVETEPDARAKLRRLIRNVTTGPADAQDRIEFALIAAATHPLVAPAVGRITERRIAYVAQLYGELGWSQELARRQALLAFTTWLGHTQLVHAAPEVLPSGTDAAAYLEHVLNAVVEVPVPPQT